MEYRVLSNGVRMPMIGFGVFQIPDHAAARKATAEALAAGYRLIDTAQAYGNEVAVGEAVRESGIQKDEVMVTTKLWISDFSYDGAIAAAERSMKRLGTDRIDLLLLHQPMGDYIGAWRGLERMYRDGRLGAIGMANCYPHVLADLCETFEIPPMVNQVEMHPFFQQELNLRTMESYGVVPEAWGPFNEGRHGLFTDPVLTSIGEAHGKTAAQTALRWNIQRGVVVIPKSVHGDRIRENIDVFDFRLSEGEMERIAAMDTGRSEIVDHFDPEWIRFLHSYRT